LLLEEEDEDDVTASKRLFLVLLLSCHSEVVVALVLLPPLVEGRGVGVPMVLIEFGLLSCEGIRDDSCCDFAHPVSSLVVDCKEGIKA